MRKVVVIGAGPAGMMAALTAAENGNEVTLFEHNEKTGKKLFLTGKGRCNLTNACDVDELFEHITRNPKFLYSAIHRFDNGDVMKFFEQQGLRLKIERGNRVFPQSDHSSDVIKALNTALRKAGVTVRLNSDVRKLLTQDGGITGVVYDSFDDHKKGQTFLCDAVIIACGGVSYPSTGSDGSGWRMLEELGHTRSEIRPSLIGVRTGEDYILRLQGLTLKNISLLIRNGKKKLYEEFGELLFTHQGISGPVVLTASSVIADKYWKENLDFEIDLKPSLTPEQLDRRLQRDFSQNLNKQFRNALSGLLPSKLIPVIVELSGVDPEKKVHSVTREERNELIRLLKHFPGTITGLGKMEEAIITRGGIKVKEVNPSTMESRLIRGLYVCGEMLDVDAVTGGFNLQIAWSTGHLAGCSV